jgi:flagellar motor switch protein FliN/FliY
MLQDTAEVLEGREIMVEEIKNEELPKKESNRKVTIQQPEFSNLDNRKVESNIDNLDLLMDVPLDFSVVLGNSRKSIKDILSLGVGSVVELDKLTDEPLEVYVNSKLIAKGEVVVINENFGIRITNILSQKQRINNLH